MFVTFIHENGTPYTVQVSQVVVSAEDGQPCAITYEHGGIILHTDITKKDFDRVRHQLRVDKLTPEEIGG